MSRTTAAKVAALEKRLADAPDGRERLDALLDDDSFTPFGSPDRAQSVITGTGTIDGRPVWVISQTPGLTDDDVSKIVTIMDRAISTGCPLVIIHHGHDDPGRPAPSHARILRRHTRASGVIPQISVIMGSVTGSAALAAPLTDVVIMLRSGRLSVNDSEVLHTATGTAATEDDRGSALGHAQDSGLAHLLADDEDEALELVAELLGFLPGNNLDDPPRTAEPEEILEPDDTDRELDALVPDSPHQPYDLLLALTAVLDDADYREIQPWFGQALLCVLGRLDGQPVGVVASRPMHEGGYLDHPACRKAARFVRTCDAFNLPVLTLADAPGFSPEAEQEQGGLPGPGAMLGYAYAEASVPMITCLLGPMEGAAHRVLGSKHLGADLTLAWPTARIDGVDPEEAARRGWVDAVILPRQTRSTIARALRALRGNRVEAPAKKHGNLPL